MDPANEHLLFARESRLRVYRADARAQVDDTCGEQALLALLGAVPVSSVSPDKAAVVSSIQIDAPALILLRGSGDGVTSSLSISKPVFVALSQTFGLPSSAPTFADVSHLRNGCLASHLEYDDHSGLPAHLSITLLTPWAPRQNYILSLRIDLTSRRAAALQLDTGIDDPEHLFVRLAKRRSLVCSHPLTLLAVLLEMYGDANESFRADLDRELVRLERRTGMTSISHSTLNISDGSDFSQLNREVHHCNTNLIILENMLAFEARFADFCTDVAARFDAATARLAAVKPNVKGAAQELRDTEHFADHLAYLRMRGQLNRTQAGSLAKRAQAQISALFSLISQRDSAAMMQDSRVMRTIAVVTLVFLPAVLVTSIFSSTVFDLGATRDSGTAIVAPLWWVWAVLSIGLTFLVVTAWVWWDKRNRKRAVLLEKRSRSK